MKKLFIPLTLERVGSEGKFFTDNTLLKLLATGLIGLLVGMLLYSFLRGIIFNILAIALSIGAAVIIMYRLLRFWVLREKELFQLLQKLTLHKIVNVGEFSDIYDFVDNIAMHSSGYMSGFVKITRGSTLGMDDTEKESYYRCIKLFEDSLLASGYSFKVFNFETPVVKDSIFKDQLNGCRKINQKNLENNLNLKNTYIKVFMENCLRDEEFIYCITAEQSDTEHFKLKIDQATRNLVNKHIREVGQLTPEEVREFATEFFDVQYFEFESTTDEDLQDILTVEE